MQLVVFDAESGIRVSCRIKSFDIAGNRIDSFFFINIRCFLPETSVHNR